MNSFQSSLRSSTKSSPTKASKELNTGRRSNNMNFSSSFNDNENKIIIDLKPSELKSIQNVLNNNKNTNISNANIWEPPLSCIKINSSSNTVLSTASYFLLELNTSDYINRIFRIIAVFLTYLFENKSLLTCIDTFNTISTNSSNVHITTTISSFIQIFHVYSKEVETNRRYLSDILIGTSELASFIQIIVDVHKKEFSLSNISDFNIEQGKLKDLTTLFNASKSLINCIVDTYKHLRSLDISEFSNELLDELSRLEEQQRLHNIFKEQRMKLMGWAWKSQPHNNSVKNISSNNSVYMSEEKEIFVSEADCNENSINELQENNIDLLFNEFSELSKQLYALLQPSSLANIQLQHRLLCIVHDLDTFMRAVSEDNEFDEAQRIRDLKSAVDSTVTLQGRSLLDLVRQSCMQAQLLIVELKKQCENIRVNGTNYTKAQECDGAIKELSRLQHELRSVGLGKFSLLSQPEVIQLIANQGSACIDANFLFLAPHHQISLNENNASIEQRTSLNTTIGSLIIRAGSNSVLNAIRFTWPNFTALKGNTNGDFNFTLNSSNKTRSLDIFSPSNSYQGSSPIYKDLNNNDFSSKNGSPSKFVLTEVDSPNSFSFSPKHFTTTAQSLHETAASFFAQGYNEVGFSPTILNVLISFEDLQKQLNKLITPHSIALNELLYRLIGVSADLLGLAEFNRNAELYSESDRLLLLRDAVESTIDADMADENNVDDEVVICGRGRARIDNLNSLINQVHHGRRELQRLAIRARIEKDFTGAQALDAVVIDLQNNLFGIEQSILPFSMLEVENDSNMSDVGFEINERISREGTSFLTSDFIFQFSSRNQRSSIGSLAIVAGAGAILRHMRTVWPQLTALSAIHKLPTGEIWDPLSYEFESSQEMKLINGSLNFRDANSMRLLGYGASALRLAGFSDVDVLTAGYTASELRDANFSTEDLRNIGLVDNTLRVVGYHIDQQIDSLIAFFDSTSGSQWKDNSGWNSMFHVNANSSSLNNTLGGTNNYTSTIRNSSLLSILNELHGVKCDSTTGELFKLNLPVNNLNGSLPENIGYITSLTQLTLSGNNLAGNIPVSLGLLSNLESLCLDRNQLEGEIPKSFKSLQRLIVLKLEFNKLSGTIPAILGGLVKLRRLDLSNNRLTGNIPTKLTLLSSIQELLLSQNKLSGLIPAQIGNLTKLSTLHLHSNNLEGSVPLSIRKLSQLTGLYLQDNPELIVDRLQLQNALPKCRIKL